MPSERERMLDGELYDPSDPELVADRRAARELTAEYNGTAPAEDAGRRELLAELFGSVGEDATVEPDLRCEYGYNVHVGDRFFANFDPTFLDISRIEFGDDCMLGPGVGVYTATHPLDAGERSSGGEYGKPVTVGDSVWVGGQAVLNPGVTVGDRAVIGSGAVVTADVPADVVAAGNPARVVKEL